MTLIDASQIIEKFIEEWYNCIFTGKAEVVKLDEDTYTLRLKLNQKDIPLNYTIQASLEDFVEFIKDQIRKNRLNSVQYFSGYMYEPRGNY